MEDKHRQRMEIALTLAREAHAAGDFPIGAVVAGDGTIIATGRNHITTVGGLVEHAEMRALRDAGARLQSAAPPLTVYTSLEPCPMCFGATLVSHIDRIVWACADPFGGATHLAESWPWPHLKIPELIGEPYDDLREESRRMMVAFFHAAERDDLLEAWRAAGYGDSFN